MAVRDGALTSEALISLAEQAGSRAVSPTRRPLVVKTCGMGWQDLAAAVAAYRRKQGMPEQGSLASCRATVAADALGSPAASAVLPPGIGPRRPGQGAAVMSAAPARL